MRSSVEFAILSAALALGGCSSAWWNDSPATAVPSAATPAADLPPAPSDWATGGTTYPEPAATPSPRPQQPLAPAPEQSGYEPPAPQMPPVRYDNVGYAAWSNEPGTVAAAHASLPVGSFAEVTAIETGKTILVPITARSRPGREIELSGAAAQELGLGYGGQAGVRVRAANATGGDIAALKAGRPAPARPDTPPVLINALRRKLAGTLGQADPAPGMARAPQPTPVAAPPPARRPVAAATRPPATAPRAGPGYYVQVAALADLARARSVAAAVGGAIASGGGLHRVRFGPFDDLKTAQAARDDVAARGYGDARIVRQD